MSTHTARPDLLPDVSEEAISRMERGIFDRIRHDRDRSRARRGRLWLGTSAAAAFLVIAAVISPVVLGGIAGTTSEAGSAVAPAQDSGGGQQGFDLEALPPGAIAGTTAEGQGGGTAPSTDTGRTAADGFPVRELIASGSLSLRVEDVDAAAGAVAREVESRGGYVESMNIDASGTLGEDAFRDGAGPYTGTARDPSMPVIREGAWVQVRVPAGDLTALMVELRGLGDVTASSVSRQDVTEQALDLRARIASAEASVARLTELMAQSDSVADLIAAETALSERQATLESHRQQLEHLEQQVALSSLVVDLTERRSEPVAANPAGFGDGIAAGWNGLVVTLNGIVVALGFLLPWVGVLALAAALVWAIAALRRRRRSGRALARPAGDDSPTRPS